MKEFLEPISEVIDLLGIAILVVAALKFFYQYLIFELRRFKGLECMQLMRNMRVEMGGYILLALEVLIISDVIHSAITHTLEDFYELGMLVLIRTMIGYFLGKEIKELKEEA
ncbi:DUF1622 domain-containing protein [Pseudobacteriovorax antillogorgiicola]|uniref:DUF1622 domain-containing protein n=1 Tax=Pseudobacteriovorax antillogorgiicola TaxID=1513793 RepID=A0A1Y6CRD5_9BACT|nr:DUF1622 domain-containing protein [Pseudobacteriovorax antillogorgiicola]TCS42228.1 uncharacterized protein DUF1622 [Pseudobacteriovorax antillogorgiicola]SMF82741.1 Protein of unknown function [Pseudobacteriovorax antillogorgiicola]